MLPLFGAIPDPGRVVRDGDIITGGGVTAGIDFALVVAAELAGEDFAQAMQLGIEYAPAPPFNAGRPETAPPAVLAAVQRAWRSRMPARLAGAEARGGEARRLIVGVGGDDSLFVRCCAQTERRRSASVTMRVMGSRGDGSNPRAT